MFGDLDWPLKARGLSPIAEFLI